MGDEQTPLRPKEPMMPRASIARFAPACTAVLALLDPFPAHGQSAEHRYLNGF